MAVAPSYGFRPSSMLAPPNNSKAPDASTASSGLGTFFAAVYCAIPLTFLKWLMPIRTRWIVFRKSLVVNMIS